MKTVDLIISAESKLKDAISQINRNGHGFVCVVGPEDRVEGTVTDGDIRRAILNGFELSEPCKTIMNDSPVVISEGMPKHNILDLFRSKKIRNIPVLSAAGKLIDVIHLSDFLEEPSEEVEKVAVIMAGGEGRRLRPFTENIPKPMLELDGKPILEHIILKLKDFGFKKFYLSVNYLSEVIIDYFGDGASLGVKVSYLKETKKLGTAGSLSMLPKGEGPVLVLNGDLISDVNFQQLFDSHLEKKADFSMAASTYKFEIPFGVLKLEGEEITGVDEKPTKTYLCNAGIYMLSPKAYDLVPEEERFDMTELLNKAVKEGLQTNVFPLHECWLDIGRKEDLLKAKNGEI